MWWRERRFTRQISGWILLASALLMPATVGASGTAGELPTFRPNDALTRSGLEHLYNMDYDHAIADLEKAASGNSQEPYAINHLANAYLIRELYRMGALDPADYLTDSFIGKPKRPATEEAKRKIQQLLEQATTAEEGRLQKDPNDVGALYARGVTRGMRSSYTGLIDRSFLAALRSAVGSRRDHERVLELSPGFVDAKLIVGTHDYIVGSLPWPVKATASLVGFSGNPGRGIEELYAAANGGGEASIDAKILLALFLRRENRFDEALRLVRNLKEMFPQNTIIALQEGDMLSAAHRPSEALAAFKKVWDAGNAGHLPFGNYEAAAIGMGDAQHALQDDAHAVESYNLLEGRTKVPSELRQRAALGAGQIYDLQHKRELALQKYNQVVALDGSSKWADTARKYLHEPFNPGPSGRALLMVEPHRVALRTKPRV